jgi:hypothetical protein
MRKVAKSEMTRIRALLSEACNEVEAEGTGPRVRKCCGMRTREGQTACPRCGRKVHASPLLGVLAKVRELVALPA